MPRLLDDNTRGIPPITQGLNETQKENKNDLFDASQTDEKPIQVL